MQNYSNFITDTSGNPVAGATVTVTDLAANAVPVYAANAVGANINPITTGPTGGVTFYAPNGRYRLRIALGGTTLAVIQDVQLFDPAEGFEDGTAAAPGIAFAADANTGIRRVAPDVMALVVGGQDAAVLHQDGISAKGIRAGDDYGRDIGRNITVFSSEADTAQMPYFVTNSRALPGSNGTSYEAGGLLMAGYRDVRSTAYLGGVTLRAQNVNGVTSIGLKLSFRIGGASGGSGGDSFQSEGAAALPIERMSVSDTGALSVEHDTGAISGTNFARFNFNGVAIGSISQSGTTAVTYNTTSDHRLKTGIRNADAMRFMDIQFRDFEWVDGRHDCGVIAHELQEIYPDLVSGAKDATEMREVEIEPAVTEQRLVSEAVPTVYDGDQIVTMGRDAVYETVVITPAVTELREFPIYQQVNYQGLIGRMGAVIQQQHRALEALAARVEALESLQAT